MIAFTAESWGSIPGWETKIPKTQATAKKHFFKKQAPSFVI